MPYLNSEKSRRRHADNRKQTPIEPHLAVQYFRIARELTVQEGIADHRPRRSTTRLVVFRRKRSPHHRRHTQHVEEISADEQSFRIPRLTAVGQIEPLRAPRHHPGKRLLVFL